nr:PGF-pre-PGF domain-containing protein [uncultured Methanoregula sp.]
MNRNPFSSRILLPALFFVLILSLVAAASAAAPTVSSIAPSSGPNTTTVSITNLAGTGFQSGANITLTPVNVTPVHKGSIADGAGTGGALLDGPNSVYVVGNYAYVVSTSSNALEIVNISNPAYPVHTGSISNGGGGGSGALLDTPWSVYVSGNYAYVASYGSSALEIVNISNPESPTHTGSIADGGGGGSGALLNNPTSVYVVGNYAYVASDTSNALEIVNISNPESPTHTGSIADGGGGGSGALLTHPYSVYVVGNYAYVASKGSNALEIVNISDPADPTHEGSIEDGSSSGTGVMLDNPYSVYVVGNYAYVTSSGSSALEIVDISNPASPSHAANFPDGTGGARMSTPYGVYVSGNYAYVTSYGNSALEIVDISSPTSPSHAANFPDGAGGALLSTPNGVYISGDYAYVASAGSGALEIVNISNPASPTHKGSISNGGGGGSGALLNSPYSVYVLGNYAYVASAGSDALEIVDISNPASPSHKGSISNGDGGALLNHPQGVYVSGNYAYVASRSSNALEIVDISNPASPTHKASIVNGAGGALLSEPFGVYVSGTYAYVAAKSSNALEIVDIGNIPLTSANVASATKITGTFDLKNRIAGLYHVVVTNPDNQFGTLSSGFTITNGTAAAPTVTGITPSSGQNTTSISITNLSGTGFSETASVNLTRAGYSNITATSVTVVSSSNITCTFDLTNKIPGTWNVNVTNPDGQQAALLNGFTITNTTPAPTVTGITPSTGQNTTSISITNLAGTGFYGTPTVNLTKTGYSNITATSVTVVSSSNITCTFNLANKIPGTWNVNVTNPDGQQAALLNGFTITNTTPAPTVTGISPSTGQNTTSVSITNLAGTGFYGTPTVNLTRAGYSNITATGVTLVSANQLTCSFDLANRPSGTWNVNVTNPDGRQAALLNGFEITNSSTPTPTPTPTPNPTPTASGGGDVGPVQRQQSASSGSGMSIANGAPAGGAVTYSFGEPVTDYPVSIESISFVPDQAIGQSQCLITRTSPQEAFTVPDRPAVYESIQINWINPNMMSDAVIQFSVKGSWLREQNIGPQDVVMMRQHDLIWAEIPTVFDHVANDMYFYRATTPGFSNFAVSVRKNVTAVVIVSNTTTIPTTSPTLTTTATATAVTTRIPTSVPVKRTSPTPTPVPAPAVQPETGVPVLYILAGIVIIIIAAAGFFFGRRWWWARQNPGLFRKY